MAGEEQPTPHRPRLAPFPHDGGFNYGNHPRHHRVPEGPALRYYATYGDLCGIATRVAGGYTFRPDTTQATRLVSATDPALVLLGRCDLADASRAADEAAGGLAARICGA